MGALGRLSRIDDDAAAPGTNDGVASLDDATRIDEVEASRTSVDPLPG
jgi:hypothetical protein